MSCFIKNTFPWPEAHLLGPHSLPVPLGTKACLGLGKETMAGLAQLLLQSGYVAFYSALVLWDLMQLPPAQEPQSSRWKRKTTIVTCPAIIRMASWAVSGKNPSRHDFPGVHPTAEGSLSTHMAQNRGDEQLRAWRAHWKGTENHFCCKYL